MKETLVAGLAAALVCVSLSAQTWNWRLATDPMDALPTASADYGMAYDIVRQRTVLFGGLTVQSAVDTTWEFDGTNWTTVTPATSPEARRGHSMVYDLIRNRIVMFGGERLGSYYSDTWEYDGANWSIVTPTTRPSPRMFHSMDYDLGTGKVVLYGGVGTGTPLQDTWEFDGTDWQQVLSGISPPVRYGASLTYDSVRSKMVLFGGYNAGVFRGDTWEYDAGAWTQLLPAASPPARHAHAAAFNSASGRVVLAGGRLGSPMPDLDTWEFDGSNWVSSAAPTTPPDICCQELVFDLASFEMVMVAGFGNGNSYLSDVWRYALGQPSQVSAFGTGCGAPALELLADPYYKPVLGETVRAQISNAPTPAVGVTLGLDDQTSGGLPLPLDLSVLGMPGCFLYHSGELLGLTTTTLGTVEQLSMPLPNQPALLNVSIFAQAYAFAPGANTLQVITSNALEWVLGDV